jgi:hypothetical protein
VQVLSTSPTAPTTLNPPSATPVRTVIVSGVITSVNASDRTIVVNGATVSVPPTATIRNQAGTLSFADLIVGVTVRLTATRSGSTITASEVIVKESPQPVTTTVHIEGQVSGLSGACPAITFTLSGISVSTNSATVFAGLGCGAVANGAPVNVRGIAQSNGSIMATLVSQTGSGR